MRQLILDTETTGLDPKDGHRIIEFAALEMIDRELTGERLHLYINPERLIDPNATRIHGIKDEDVADKPVFKDVAQQIVEYIKDSELIIHNAKFDIGFLDYQFKLVGLNLTTDYIANVIDTLTMARQKFPGAKNNLDALCDRFKVDRKDRGYHGALIDCRLLSDVYLWLTRQQISLDGLEVKAINYKDYKFERLSIADDELATAVPSANDLEMHNQILAKLNKSSKGKSNWFNNDNK
jgi:DNA polymerase-3 subunit epsilon